ncbi:MAG: hypothetical protein R2912_09530 [Eubacteriales bacterium]
MEYLLAEKKKGAQNVYSQSPDYEMFSATELKSRLQGLIKIADVAPELPGAIDYVENVSQSCRVSIAHTDADYAAAGCHRGGSHVSSRICSTPQRRQCCIARRASLAPLRKARRSRRKSSRTVCMCTKVAVRARRSMFGESGQFCQRRALL